MKVVVVVDIPGVEDPDSDDATNAISILSDELEFLSDRGYDWYVDDATED
jgi:hypothetical protein